jgi:hypothetical protein
MASPLDGYRQLALMTGADGCLPPGFNLSSVGEKPTQEIRVFIIYLFYLLCAEETTPPRRGVLSTPNAPLLWMSLFLFFSQPILLIA